MVNERPDLPWGWHVEENGTVRKESGRYHDDIYYDTLFDTAEPTKEAMTRLIERAYDAGKRARSKQILGLLGGKTY